MKRLIYLIIIITLTFFGSVHAEIGLKFLAIPNSTREMSMGETGVSYFGSGSAIWLNPAHMASGTSDVWFQGFRWIADGKGSYGGTRIRTSWGGLGVYYFNHGMDGFEVRDRPGDSQGTFAIHQSVVAAGISYRFTRELATGVVYKGTFEDIYGSTYYTWGIFDWGIIWNTGDTGLGASISNIGVGGFGGVDLPLTGRLGVSRRLEKDDFSGLLVAEGVFAQKDTQYLHLGAETGWRETLHLRLGYMFGHDTRSLTCGLGTTIGRYRMDFALIPVEAELGTTWRIGVGFDL